MVWFLISWMLVGLISHVYTYLAYRWVCRNDLYYYEYMKQINPGKPESDWDDPNQNFLTVFLTMMIFILIGYFSLIYLFFTTIKNK